jgi:hypothetical protein
MHEHRVPVTPDFGKFQEAIQSDRAAEAMKRDGVHADALLVLEEA